MFHPVRLPMYDWPEVRAATAELELALQTALIDCLDLDPVNLQPWPEEFDAPSMWDEPGVLLTQTCGYPLTHGLRGLVRLVGVPHYAAEGCIGGRYCSQLVVAGESSFKTLADLRGQRAAYNGSDSQSGMNAFRHSVAPLAGGAPFFCEVLKSGSHLQSMKAVAEGRADIASVDAVCWHLAKNELPDLTASLRPIGQTASATGLPLITSLRFSQEDTSKIADAVERVFHSPLTADCRDRLGICGFSRPTLNDYADILLMEQEAERQGYPILA
ncbi:phosphate/phosphite/phosphonate ABC transporter substrate-binding protein [Roseibium sp. MMSF_3544]|uniref:phosphate/phosphite/phosphonate ABC transporter substrate-binding protein n=1 Tax=unclassified Roseibium TaxID=2629323 RepID=UPI00273FEC47|nr:PhnD/SsuA/transferrin family substrate-binding protein [Roseibium sp. MMSF_3544]